MFCKKFHFNYILKKVNLIRTKLHDINYYSSIVSPSALDGLTHLLGKDSVSVNVNLRQQHSIDESDHKALFPDVVIYPHNTTQVSNVMKLCYSQNIPVVPFGTGTGLEGGVIPLKGGVCMDLTKNMTNISDLNLDDMDVKVEPGVTRLSLNKHLKDYGLWFPVDPGADASLCGMVATSASGTNAVRYGTMKFNVLNLEIVMSDGMVFHTSGPRGKSRKTAAGYDLTSLFIGSEGTLGIITSATLKLYGIPEATVSAVCQFSTIREAVDSTIEVLQNSIPIARIEFLDEISMEHCIRYSQLEGYSVQPTLFLEFHGTDASVQEQAKIAEKIMLQYNGSGFKWARDTNERNKLWSARHNALYASKAININMKCHLTDVAVPIGHLADIVVWSRERIKHHKLKGNMVGHVGDGNFHVLIFYDPNDSEQDHKCKMLTDDISRKAISIGGTCTGEHGIGIGKMHLLREELGSNNLKVMKEIKKALDPKGILNFGKVISEDNM